MDNHYDQGRRKFLKNSGIVGLPCLLPAALLKNNTVHHQVASKNKQAINFITDMPLRNASEYLSDRDLSDFSFLTFFILRINNINKAIGTGTVLNATCRFSCFKCR